jgi:hypothetical protein
MRPKLFYKKTVREYIGGYEDPLLKIAKAFMPNLIKSDIFTLTYNVIIKTFKQIELN